MVVFHSLVTCSKQSFKANQRKQKSYHKIDGVCLYEQKECETLLDYCGSFSLLWSVNDFNGIS